MDISDLNPLAKDLMGYMQKKIGFSKPPSAITYQDDSENAGNILGKTAYYNPNDASITIFVTKRHPKDILRSLAHELVHHKQNEDGNFDDIGEVGEGYAQSNEKLRGMEREAYEKGNMCFRDWEDGYKNAVLESIYKQQQILRRNKTMDIHKWKNNELNRLLMERFGINEKKDGNKKTDKHDDSPKLKGKQKNLPDNLQKGIIDAEGGESEEDKEKVEEAMQKKELAKAANKWLEDNPDSKLSQEEVEERIMDGKIKPPKGEKKLKESKQDRLFRKKVRLMLESFDFKKKNNKKVTVRRRRK
tara:strand:+ start:724 stop:1629 length:906 start_codon:yes stop_codon:yes gene_type:complete